MAIGATLAGVIGETLEVATGHQLFPLAEEVPATDGSTIRHIEEGLRIVTERLRTDLEEPRAETRSPTVKPGPGSRWGGRAAIFRVPAEEPVRATARAEG